MQHRDFLKLSSLLLCTTGLVLIFGPRNWFPAFYNPIYMGIVSLVSPILIYLPKFFLQKSTPRKRNLILQMRSVIAFSLLVNVAGELGLFQLYKFGFEYDKFAHFLVPMLFAFILSESLREWEHFSQKKIFLITFIIVFASGILWELFEILSDYFFKTQEWGVYGDHVASDTYKDMFFNALGTLSGIIVSMIPKGKWWGKK